MKNGFPKARVRQFVSSVLKTNLFYRRKYASAGISNPGFIRSVEDFWRLPLTTRRELIIDQQKHPPFGTNLTRPIGEYTYVIHTSGTTTGTPMFQPLTHAEYLRFADVMARGYKEMGVKRGDVICYLSSAYAYPLFYEISRSLGVRMVPADIHTSLDLLNRLKSMKVTVLHSYPSALFALIELAREHRIDLKALSLRLIVTIGEVGGGYPPTKAYFEKMWGARVVDHIGSLESGTLAVICPKGRGYHLLPDLFVAEVFDPHRDVRARRGELVLTSLWKRDYPLIRYRTGDMVELDEAGHCPCGNTNPLLVGGVLGRTTGQIKLRGLFLFPEDIERVLRNHTSIVEYQIIVRKRVGLDTLDVFVEYPDNVSREELERLLVDLEKTVGFTPNIYPVLPKRLPRFGLRKGKRFHDYRASDSRENLWIGRTNIWLSKMLWFMATMRYRTRAVARYMRLLRRI